MGVIIDKKSKQVLFKIKNAPNNIRRETRLALFEIGKLFKKTANKNTLKRPRHGRTYTINGKRHTASRPGESWANLSGKARKGLKFKVVSSNKMIYSNAVFYTKFLEGKLNRPAMLISIKESSNIAMRILNKRVKKSF